MQEALVVVSRFFWHLGLGLRIPVPGLGMEHQPDTPKPLNPENPEKPPKPLRKPSESPRKPPKASYILNPKPQSPENPKP